MIQLSDSYSFYWCLLPRQWMQTTISFETWDILRKSEHKKAVYRAADSIYSGWFWFHDTLYHNAIAFCFPQMELRKFFCTHWGEQSKRRYCWPFIHPGVKSSTSSKWKELHRSLDCVLHLQVLCYDTFPERSMWPTKWVVKFYFELLRQPKGS